MCFVIQIYFNSFNQPLKEFSGKLFLVLDYKMIAM